MVTKKRSRKQSKTKKSLRKRVRRDPMKGRESVECSWCHEVGPWVAWNGDDPLCRECFMSWIPVMVRWARVLRGIREQYPTRATILTEKTNRILSSDPRKVYAVERSLRLST